MSNELRFIFLYLAAYFYKEKMKHQMIKTSKGNMCSKGDGVQCFKGNLKK